MAKYKCSVCGYIHDEEKDGAWENLPSAWVCPWCKAEKSAFVKEGAEETTKVIDHSVLENAEKELTTLELSAVCSNLARGCEKQYLNEESELFKNLADYFKENSEKTPEQDMSSLLELIEKDLAENFPLVEVVAKENSDRGALRAYTWSTKVTMILKSLLEKYEQTGDEMLHSTGVYVCTICGFIYVGNDLPKLCPVCKVPNYKFEEVGGQTNE